MPIPAGGGVAVGGTTYAELTELKAWLTGITDTDRDVPLQLALATASRYVDGYTGRRFDLAPLPSTRTFSLRDYVDGNTLLVDDIGDTAGLVVETGTESGGWNVVTTYTTEPENATDHGWPVTALYHTTGWRGWTSVSMRVTARWGWPVVPEPVKMATLIQAARLFKRKDSPEGVLGSSDWGTVRVSRVDPDVAALLADYRYARVA